MDQSVFDAHLHHQLIPHREQSAAYGISSSQCSVHSPYPLLPDKLPSPPPIDSTVFWYHNTPLPPPHQENQMAIALSSYPSVPLHHYEPQEENTTPGGREKRHCCQLCNKRFDRPSTLKKHMLVHTGEKAWACEICGRRFSVSSNLNRHSRRCKEKWARSDSSAAAATATATDIPPPSAVSEHTDSSSSPSSSYASDPCRPESSPHLTDHPWQLQSASCPVRYEIDDRIRSHDQRHPTGKTQRKRRKGSSAEPWIPPSLANFNLEPSAKYVPSPLPAVVPSTREERNSYANTPSQAYHPSCWTGNLVGPSYAPGNEEMSRGRYCGKLLVF